MISLQYCGKIYNISKEPHETIEESYMRAWFIVKNYSKYEYDELYSLSIMMINEKKGMNYLISSSASF